MKVMIDETEWYPVFELDDDLEYGWGKPIEVSDQFFKEYKQLMDRFDSLQTDLKKLYYGRS